MNALALAQWMIFSQRSRTAEKFLEHNAFQQGLSRQLGGPLADQVWILYIMNARG
jgi:hypothetical protein